jgi:uncharacterized protein (UPF0333 family)
MNKRGQAWGYALMLGIIVIILGLALAPAGAKVIGDAMNKTKLTNYTYEVWNDSSSSSYTETGQIEEIGLDCDNSSISNFDKGTCIIMDYGLVYFFGAIILIGGGLIIARIFF